MSPRPKNAPKARLTLCAPLRLSSTCFGLRAVSPGLFSAGSVLTTSPAAGSTGWVAVWSPPVGAGGTPLGLVPGLPVGGATWLPGVGGLWDRLGRLLCVFRPLGDG